MADSNHLKKRRLAQVAGQRPSHHPPQASSCEVHHVSMSVQTLEEPNRLPRLAHSKRIPRSLSRPNIRCSADLAHRPDNSLPPFMSALGASRRLQHGEQQQQQQQQRDANLGAKTTTATAPPKIPERSRTLDAGVRRSRARMYSDSTKYPPVAPAVTYNASSSSIPPAAPAPDAMSRHFNGTCPPPVEYPSGSSHFSRGSSSVASESTESSPTTASSTFDSPIIVDQSPSSSPESPSSVTPLSSVKPTAQCVNGGDAHTRPPPSDTLLPPIRPDSPRKGRNLKNLSLKLAPPKQSYPSLSTAPVGGERPRNISAPSSPIHPVSKPSRRKQPNLTIQTPVLGHSSTDIGQLVPPTPTSKPTLRHFESSPSLNSIQSPTMATFPSLSSHLQSAQQTDVDNSQQASACMPSARPGFSRNGPLQALGEEDDYPVSRESSQGNEKGYPDGPIRIYDSGLYLYAEPNREEASNFDVVFNVAKEIANPFRKESMHTSVMSVWKAGVSDSSPQDGVTTRSDTARSEPSFGSRREPMPSENQSPTTPRADKSEPEYIHVPWAHNSEILDDLYTLCEMIDERISKGKSVLIHCQLGVSRSASLVIAYGLYKNPSLDFNSIYSIVKERSCWVGPNMSLIYQLTDFRSRVRQGGPTKPPPEEWFSESSRSLLSRPSKPVESSTTASSSRHATADQGKSQLSSILSPNALRESPAEETPSFLHQSSSARPVLSSRTRRNMPCRPLPLREKYQTIHSFRHSSRVDGTSLCGRSVSQPRKQTEVAKHDEAPDPNTLFSPKGPESGFQDAPFSRNSAGDLALPRDSIDFVSCKKARPPAVAADPRSPQQRREPLIMRNIDEFL